MGKEEQKGIDSKKNNPVSKVRYFPLCGECPFVSIFLSFH